jgi:Mn-dependent DtxR family transcriptional regulator
MNELDDFQKEILKALADLKEPAGCKAIGEKAGIPWRTVMAKLRGLKKGEYVDSPIKGKYVITEKGKIAT